MSTPIDVDGLIGRLAGHDYLADRSLATVVGLALELDRPLLLEGEAGVGKTELAKVLAAITGGRLIRLQCYEGIDVANALYDWDYARQMLYIRTLEAAGGRDPRETMHEVFGREFLLRRPLLEAVEHADAVPPVLLIDEIDRADDEFEAFLLELLADFQVTIPEVGTIAAATPPHVVLTSNRTRELHDALRRRCLYHWIDHPDRRREAAILRVRVPQAGEVLTAQVAAFAAEVRGLDLIKLPGVAETVDWTQALVVLGGDGLDGDTVELSMGSLIKHPEDLEAVRAAGIERLVASARRG